MKCFLDNFTQTLLIGGTVEKKRGRDEESDELSDYDDNQEEEKEGRFLQQKQIDRYPKFYKHIFSIV